MEGYLYINRIEEEVL
jgi:V-type H+-transporting ATPase subunit a